MTIDDAKRRLEALGFLVFLAEDEIFIDERRSSDLDGIAVSRPVFRILRVGEMWTVMKSWTVIKSFVTLERAVEAVINEQPDS